MLFFLSEMDYLLVTSVLFKKNMASLYSNILVKNADYFIPCRTDPSREVYSKQNEEKAYSL